MSVKHIAGYTICVEPDGSAVRAILFADDMMCFEKMPHHPTEAPR